VVAEDVVAEQARFDEALGAVREDVDRLLEAEDMQSGEHREILETFRMFADDRGWMERVREAIGSGLTAEAAVQRAFDDVRTRLGQSTDPYIRERLSDLQDLSNRLLVRPADDILQSVYGAIETRAERRRKYAALRDLPSATRDQAKIGLHMNAGLLIDMQHLDETGADGIGLYRTEIPFMVRSEFPDV